MCKLRPQSAQLSLFDYMMFHLPVTLSTSTVSAQDNTVWILSSLDGSRVERYVAEFECSVRNITFVEKYVSVSASGGSGRLATNASCFGGLGQLYRVKVWAVSGPNISRALVCIPDGQCREEGGRHTMPCTVSDCCVMVSLVLKGSYIAIAIKYINILFDGCSNVERSVHCSWPLHVQAGWLKLDKSLDITPTSLLHHGQHGVTGGWGAGALLMATSDHLPPLNNLAPSHAHDLQPSPPYQLLLKPQVFHWWWIEEYT